MPIFEPKVVGPSKQTAPDPNDVSIVLHASSHARLLAKYDGKYNYKCNFNSTHLNPPSLPFLSLPIYRLGTAPPGRAPAPL